MKAAIRTYIVLLLTAFLLVSCSSDPVPQKDPYNPADSQRTAADKAQDELSSETK